MAVFGGYRLTRTGVLFIVGILVLGGLVTGGIFLVKNHGEAVRRGEAVKVAEKSLEEQSKTSAEGFGASNTDGNSGTDAAKPSGPDAAPSTTPSTTPAQTTPAPSELPVTGIDDLQFIGRAAILATLAISGAYYVASRRAANRS